MTKGKTTQRKGNSNWVKGMASPNPSGAPRRGLSWAELINSIGDMTPPEAAAKSLELSKQFLKIGDGVTLKEAVILRAFGSLLFDPMPSMLTALMDRAEGKPNQPVEIAWRERAKALGIDPDRALSALRGLRAGLDVDDPEPDDGE